MTIKRLPYVVRDLPTQKNFEALLKVAEEGSGAAAEAKVTEVIKRLSEHGLGFELTGSEGKNPRPVGFGHIFWYGPHEPLNATEADVYWNSGL